MNIIKAKKEHAKAIYALGQLALGEDENWTQSQYETECDKQSAIFLVADFDGQPGGFIHCDLYADDAHLNLLAVSSRFRNQGVATALVLQAQYIAIQRGGSVFSLEVRSQNIPANALYQKLGFEVVGQRKRFYTNPQDAALIRNKELKEC